MDENGPEPEVEDEDEIGGWTGFRSLISGLYTVGGVGLVVTTLAREARTTMRRWFRKG